MKNAFVKQEEEAEEYLASKSLKEIVDRAGRIDREIKKRKVVLTRLKGAVAKARKNGGKILGSEYRALIQVYEISKLNERKLKKYVPPKLLKKCYTEIPVSRIEFQRLKKG